METILNISKVFAVNVGQNGQRKTVKDTKKLFKSMERYNNEKQPNEDKEWGASHDRNRDNQGAIRVWEDNQTTLINIVEEVNWAEKVGRRAQVVARQVREHVR